MFRRYVKLPEGTILMMVPFDYDSSIQMESWWTKGKNQ